VGSHKALLLLDDVLAKGVGIEPIEDEVLQLEETLRLTSICGLGQVALGPVISVLRLQTQGQEGEQAKEVGRTRTEGV
jgi:NADH:ubiquinone oxidoreductase subunit F (NADH-binding)